MWRRSLLVVLAVLAVAAPACAAGPEPKTDDEKTLYALGLALARNVGPFNLTEKELDILGVSCCNATEFGEAVAVVERNVEWLGQLVSHRFALERAPDALRFAMDHPTEVMKVVIGGA